MPAIHLIFRLQRCAWRPIFFVVIATAGASLGWFAQSLALAANGKCCNSVDKLSECSGCIGWDDNNDNKIDWYMDIGDHSGKKCKSGNATDNCDEELLSCATVNNLTRYKKRILLVCSDQNGTAAGPYTIKVDQCNAADSACGGGM